MYTGATFRIKINDAITQPIDFESGVRQGCSLSSIIYIACLEPLLHNIRNNPKIPDIIPPRAQYEAVRRKAFPYDGIDSTIKAIAYADDIDTIVFNRDEEAETIKMFGLYNKASGGKTNVEKTNVFWISDWLPLPAFKGQVKLDWCRFLGVPIAKRGHFPPSELVKLKMSLKQNLGMWSQVSLSHLERSTILKVFSLSCIVYRFSLITVHSTTINELQNIANAFVWRGKHPTINFKTIIGKKVDGGFALLDIKTMVEGFRIKCDLHLMSNTPAKSLAIISYSSSFNFIMLNPFGLLAVANFMFTITSIPIHHHNKRAVTADQQKTVQFVKQLFEDIRKFVLIERRVREENAEWEKLDKSQINVLKLQIINEVSGLSDDSGDKRRKYSKSITMRTSSPRALPQSPLHSPPAKQSSIRKSVDTDSSLKIKEMTPFLNTDQLLSIQAIPLKIAANRKRLAGGATGVIDDVDWI
ncbi:unnamed protein product [Didymodactylos carnosus]|uniref:Reverse transcriptase domain-containing protein n=1 Tax=Didymodactylos carnosus TaxID=1234261 RepID=A0A814LMB8_9BILA|nr:unnamed protein product [Didymodactylos carnosus]CAF1068197.1 unnamed protein product [Didymodactylos carnosus]CAF3598515.1 unnamed protein product [Didymodactylos carnosus]CAF3835543.1 unnamed protein product [Didymodactylos carnosus]